METLPDLVKKREVLFMLLQNACLRKNEAEEDLRIHKLDYEEVDREIAMLQRTILPPLDAPKRKQKKPRDLTNDELKELLRKIKSQIPKF